MSAIDVGYQYVADDGELYTVVEKGDKDGCWKVVNEHGRWHFNHESIIRFWRPASAEETLRARAEA